MPFISTSVLKNIIALFLLVIGLHYAQDFLMPLAIATIIATFFLPFCRWMEGHKIPKWLATLICTLILLLFVLIIGTLIVWQISQVTNDFALLKERTIQAGNEVARYLLAHLSISIETQGQILANQPPSLTGALQVIAGSLVSIVTNFLLTVVYLFCLLYYRSHIKAFLIKLSSASNREELELVINLAALVCQQYLVGLAKVIVCLWVMYGIGFTVLGIKNALFFALLCGFLEIIPFIGNIVGTTITVLIAVVQGASLPLVGGILVTYGMVQFIQGWILEPLIVGNQVKINPLFTIIALVLGELIWGIPGIFVAIPLIAMFKIVCDHVETLKPYGFLIGEIEFGKNKLGIIQKIKNWLNSMRKKGKP
jgi:predicted PurR-regulated permease PerM